MMDIVTELLQGAKYLGVKGQEGHVMCLAAEVITTLRADLQACLRVGRMLDEALARPNVRKDTT